MSKFFIYFMLLWHGMCMISATNEFDEATNSAGKTQERIEQLTVHDWDFDEEDEPVRWREDLQVFNIVDPSGISNVVRTTKSQKCCHGQLSSGYVATNEESAFKLHLRKLPWNTARSICAEEGGHLAIPRTESEETEILKMMTEDSIDDAWLGFHDQFEEGDWVTVLDEPIAKIGWAKWSKLFPNNPDNYNGEQHCARLVRNGGGMDDDVCQLPKSFVCEISTL